MTPRATYRMRCCERVRFAETLDRRTSWFIASSFNHLTKRTHHCKKLRGFGGHSHIIIDFPSVWMTNAWENLGNQKVHGTIPLFAMLSFPMQKPLSWQMRKRGKSQDPSFQPKREATENPPHASACFRAAFPWQKTMRPRERTGGTWPCMSLDYTPPKMGRLQEYPNEILKWTCQHEPHLFPLFRSHPLRHRHHCG